MLDTDCRQLPSAGASTQAHRHDSYSTLTWSAVTSSVGDCLHQAAFAIPSFAFCIDFIPANHIRHRHKVISTLTRRMRTGLLSLMTAPLATGCTVVMCNGSINYSTLPIGLLLVYTTTRPWNSCCWLSICIARAALLSSSWSAASDIA